MPDGLLDPFAALGSLLQQTAQFIRDRLDATLEGVRDVINRLTGAALEPARLLADSLGEIVVFVQSVFDNRLQQVQLMLGNIAQAALDLPQRLGDFAQALADRLRELPGDFVKAGTDAIPDTLADLIQFLLSVGPDVFRALIGDRVGELMGDAGKAAARLLRGEMTATELLTAGTPAELQSPVGHALWGGVLLFGLLSSLIFGSQQVPGETVRQELAMIALNTLAPISAYVELERRGLAAPEVLAEARIRWGYSELQFDALRQAATVAIPPGTVLELYNRTGRDPTMLAAGLHAAGIHDSDAELYGLLADILPPPADLIRFAVKEVFNPQIAEQFGQFDEADRLPYDRFAQLGINEQHAREYWAAHWNLPSAEMGFAMFQRGIIDLDTLKLLLRALDVMPYWRERLIQLNYHPLTRVDIRRVHKALKLDHDFLVARYKATGYSPEDAEILAQFTERLNGEDDQAQIDSIRAPIRTRALSDYTKFYSTRAEADAMLKALGYTEIQRTYYLAMADHDRETQIADAGAAAAKTGYVSGLRDEEATRLILGAHGFSEPAIGRLLATWDIARLTRELSDEEKAQRDLTKAEILAAYSEKVIPKEAAEALLDQSGYDQGESDALIALQDAKDAKADLAQLVAGTRAEYVAGKLTRGEASGQLDRYGVTARRRDAYLAQWDIERAQREGHISVADLQKMLSAGILTPVDVRDQLRAQGFGEKQILWYLQLWGAPAEGAPAGPRGG